MKKRYRPGRYVYLKEGGGLVGKIAEIEKLPPDKQLQELPPDEHRRIAMYLYDYSGLFGFTMKQFDAQFVSKCRRAASLDELKPKPVVVRLGCKTQDDLDNSDRLAALDALAKRGEPWKIYPHFQDVEFEGYYAMVGDVRPGTAPINFLDLSAAIDWILSRAAK